MALLIIGLVTLYRAKDVADDDSDESDSPEVDDDSDDSYEGNDSEEEPKDEETNAAGNETIEDGSDDKGFSYFTGRKDF